jgi:transcription initiation factor IIF auxiliary subunit
VRSYIEKVRFFIHPSYSPNDIIDVTEYPFHLKRTGWGEFPYRIQIHYIDKRNKPKDIHQVLKVRRLYSLPSSSNMSKLDFTRSGLQIAGNENTIDLELDRKTQFVNFDSEVEQNLPSLNDEVPVSQEPINQEAVIKLEPPQPVVSTTLPDPLGMI